MICAVLILCMAFSLCACGGSTYGVRELEVLVEQEYSLAFRNDDSTYNYVTGNIDCAWGGIALDQKEIDAGKYTQYGPYVSNNIVVAGRNGSTIWNKLKLGGRTMAMCSTEESMAALETDPKLAKRLGQIIRLAGGTLECFEYLYSGKCDVVLTDSTALYYYNCH